MGNITRDIEIANESFNKKLLFKEDIARVIEELRKSRPDNRHTKIIRLIEMFNSYGVECQKNWSAEDFSEALENSDIPSVVQLPEFCWGEIVKLYNNYKHPKDYMERLVNNLISPCYDVSGTSVKVKILKQLLGKLNYLEGTRFYDEKLIDIIKTEYDGEIENIDDGIFDRYLTSGHIEETHKILEATIDVYSDVLYDSEEYDEKLSALISEYDETVADKKACEILSYIYENNHRDREKAVSNYVINEKNPSLVKKLNIYLQERLSCEKAELDSLIKQMEEKKEDRIEQFIYIKQIFESCKYQWHFLNDEFSEFVCSHLKKRVDASVTESEYLDAVYEKTENTPKKFVKINENLISSLKAYKKAKQKLFDAAKDRSRKKVKSPELLRVCRDVAEGRFKTAAEMKEILYILAFAFDMTVFNGADGESYDFSRDVKKQLFEDYYCDNIMRYLYNYQENGVYEDPVGITIQYKNFAEIVYLYWLSKSGDKFTPYSKFCNAKEMLERIIKTHKQSEKQLSSLKNQESKKYQKARATTDKKDKITMVYRNWFYGNEENMDYYGERDLEINELFAYTSDEFEEFILDNYDIDVQKHYTGNLSREAFENANEQNSAKIVYNDLLGKIKSFGVDEFELDFFKPFYAGIDSETEDDSEKALKFDSLIGKMNAVLKDVLESPDENSVTRTKIMLMYCCYFIHENSADDYTEIFESFSGEYIDELNEYLYECSYQRFSKKNLLDVMLLYMAFVTLRAEFDF